jgi:hypothetical protein
MKKMILSFLAISLLVVSSCRKDSIWGEGPLVTVTRPVDNFTGISSGISGVVKFTVGPVYKLEVTAQQNILDVMRTQVVNGVLEINFRNSVKVRSHEDITVNITAPSVSLLRLSGVGDMSAFGDIVTNRLDMSVSGAGDINVEKAIVAGKIDARISGSGNISIATGSATNEELRISGSGGMNLAIVPVEKAEIYISGSGDMKVNVSQSIYANISGSGSVLYKGNPTITTNISGSGTVRPF